MTALQTHGRRRALAVALSCAFAALPAAAAAQDEAWVPLDRAPADIERLMLGLKTAQTGLPLAVRRSMLARTESMEVPRAEGPPDRYLRLRHEADGLYFNVTVRTLSGASPAETVYLLQSGYDLDRCEALQPLLARDDRVGRDFCRYDPDAGVARLRLGGMRRFGFSAYRLDGARVRDATRRVLPEDPLLRSPQRARYVAHDDTGTQSGVSVDLSRFAEVPVLRLYRELADGHGLPRDDPRAFTAGYPGPAFTAHFGFLVWNGKRFELRETVPRALWPCTRDARFSPSGQSCLANDPDRFILPDTGAP
jgi:hypothetical protein